MKMYEVTIKDFSDNTIHIVKCDDIALNNLGIYNHIDYEIVEVIEIAIKKQSIFSKLFSKKAWQITKSMV